MTVKLSIKRFVSVICVSLLLLFGVFSLAEEPFENMETYKTGQYYVGMDMPSGEYVLIATADTGYFSVSSDANGRDIICNELFSVNSIITVQSGEFIELSRCIAVKASDFYSEYTIKSSNSGVMLKVGYDIDPGTYRLVATTDRDGYYCIYNDSRHGRIVENDLFSNSSYVTVSRGQYLVLERCCIQ